MERRLPKVGFRMIKTAVAVMIAYLIFVPFDLIYHTEYGGIWGQLGPLYACIACIICMQGSFEMSLHLGISRLIGVAIGGVLGVLALTPEPLLGYFVYKTLALGAVCVAGIWICVLMNRPAACAMACILPCVILVSVATGPERYYYALARIVETLVGVAVALAVNVLLPNHQHQKENGEKG